MPPKRKDTETNAPASAAAASGTATSSTIPSTTTAVANGVPRAEANTGKADVPNEAKTATGSPPKKKAKKGDASRSKNPGTQQSAAESTSKPAAVAAKEAQALAAVAASAKLLDELFDNYADKDDPQVMETTGFERLCQDCQLNTPDIYPFLLAWGLQCTSFGKCTRKEFLNLSVRLVDTPDKIRELVHFFERRINKHFPVFNDFYLYLYPACLQEGQRVMTADTAKTLWGIALAPRSRLVKDFLEFLEVKPTKGIPKDVWNQLLPFIQEIAIDRKTKALRNYNEETSAWPTMLDDYVAWVRDGRPTD